MRDIENLGPMVVTSGIIQLFMPNALNFKLYLSISYWTN